MRLYNFDGLSVVPEKTLVLHYEEKVFPEGDTYKEIITVQPFTDYNEALNYINRVGPDNYRIVGDSPYMSPVPLEAPDRYELIHSSDEVVQAGNAGTTPEVKIFEYRK